MVVQGETIALSTGQVRVHYDADCIQRGCQAGLILGVGTFMSVGDYDKISGASVESTSIVVIIADHSPSKCFTKQDSRKFANLANEVVDQFTNLMPAAVRPPTHGYIVGGHSSGGLAAIGALVSSDRQSMYSFEPTGLIGLDPYSVNSSIRIALPGMYWGFAKTTCLVSIDKAAKAAYEATNQENRVFYRIQNEHQFFRRPPTHCIFTDRGCARGICPVSDEQGYIRNAVGKTLQCFVLAIVEGSFEKSRFAIDIQAISCFVNGDEVDQAEVSRKQGETGTEASEASAVS